MSSYEAIYNHAYDKYVLNMKDRMIKPSPYIIFAEIYNPIIKTIVSELNIQRQCKLTKLEQIGLSLHIVWSQLSIDEKQLYVLVCTDLYPIIEKRYSEIVKVNNTIEVN